MKVLFLSIYNGLVDRGAEVFVKEMAIRCPAEDRALIVQGGPSGNYAFITVNIGKNYQPNGVSLFWRILRKFYLDPHSLNVMFFTLKSIPTLFQQKPDIVIAVNGFWQVVVLKILKPILKYKLAISGQAGIGRDDKWNLRLRPDIFFALTSAQKNWAQGQNKNLLIQKVGNGVDTVKFNFMGNKLKLDLPKPIVLTVAALTSYKKVDQTIKAVAQTKASLLIVGQGELAKELSTQASKTLGKKRFKITTYPHEEMPQVYRGCDLFTLASASSEAFGIAYLEAMASGLGVVAPDDEIRREIIGKAGVLVDCDDEVKYGEALEEALSKEWVGKSLEQVQKFDWLGQSEKFYDYLHKIL